MNIFGINGGELIVLIVLALLLLGPEKIPEYLRTLREWIHKARKFGEGAKAQFKEETGTDFDDVDWQKYDPRQYDPRRVIREALSEPIEDLEASLTDAKTTVHDAADTVRGKPSERPQLTQEEIIAAAVPIDQLNQQVQNQQTQFPDPSRPELSNGSPEPVPTAGVQKASEHSAHQSNQTPAAPSSPLGAEVTQTESVDTTEQPSTAAATPFDSEAT
jgi:sec-independent protein translocase protein TatB